MNTNYAPPLRAAIDGLPSVRASDRSAKLFYTGAAALMLALAFVGFSPYYLHGLAYQGREIAPSIKVLVTTHGLAMTAWLVLSLIQPLLIAVGRRRVHMTLGMFGAAFAALVVVLGVRVGIASAVATPSEAVIWGLPPKRFMAVPIISACIFAAFVGVGVLRRRRPSIHRPMMLLATLAVISAAVSRIDALSSLYLGTVWERLFGPFFLTLVLGVLLFAVRCALTRSFDRPFALGLAALIAADALIVQIAATEGWARLAAVLAA